MNWADLVVGVNRTALEAMSSGRNVYLLGQWGAGGTVTPDNVETLGKANWSGAQRGDWPTPRDLAGEIGNSYDPRRTLRPYVLAHHDPDLIAEQYRSSSCQGSREMIPGSSHGLAAKWVRRCVGS